MIYMKAEVGLNTEYCIKMFRIEKLPYFDNKIENAYL